MATFTISTDNVIIARVAGALYGYQLGNDSMNNVLASTAAVGVNSVLNSVVGRDALYNSWTPAAIATQMVANLGITTAAQVTEATAYITGKLTAVTSAQYGQTIAEILGMFSGLTSNAFYGTFATNYNNSVAAAVTRSQTADAADVASFSSVPASVGGTYVLTTAVATLTGTGFADFFEARIFDNGNSLQSNDVINGGGGIDTLNADIGLSQSFAITPETTSVEYVNIRAQAAAPDSGNGNNIVASKATIDAQRMSGVTKWASDNSRADVIIEDVRINSNVTTIEFKESDPGNVDFGVYFNQRNLVNTSGGSSSLNIYIMDTVSAVATPTEPSEVHQHGWLHVLHYYRRRQAVGRVERSSVRYRY